MINLDEHPSFHERPEESLAVARQLSEQGYRPVASILAAGNLTVRQALMLHERRTQLIRMGAIIGPCVFGVEQPEVMPGISLYVEEATR